MAAPYPLKSPINEPWFTFLRATKQYRDYRMRGLEPPREFPRAMIEICHARQALRAKIEKDWTRA